VIAIRPH